MYCNSNPVMNYFENNDIKGLNTHAKKEPDKLNKNLIKELLEYMIIFDDSNDKQPISSSSQRIPTKIFGSDVPHIKKENDFLENTASAVIENFDPMLAGGSTYGIINSIIGGYSVGGGYVNGNGDDDLVDIILAMNLW